MAIAFAVALRQVLAHESSAPACLVPTPLTGGSMRKFRSFAISPVTVFVAALALTGRACVAQVDRTAMTGTITDPSGRVMAQAHILAIETSTHLVRESESYSDGRYDLAELPVGRYTVTFDHPGFRRLVYVDVEQVIGRTRTLDAILQVSGGEQRIQVSSASEFMDRNGSAITGLIEKTQADELPLNGRDWSALTAYVPGAIDTGGSNQRSVRFAGRGLDDSNITYDGVDATNVVNQTQRAWARLSIPLDAIAEFRVDTQLSTAEEGATGGAQLSVTSLSGTDHLHGRLFEYLRNDVFDAPQPAWASHGQSQQPLRLNQFGGSLGGPIVHEKTFFYLASEAYRQVWGYPVSADVPSAAFRASVLNSSPVYAIVNGYPDAGPKSVLTPYTPQSDPGDPNYADYDLLTCSCRQTVNENSVMLRLDQHFSLKTTAFLRFNYDRAVDTQPFAAVATDLQQRVTAPVNGALELLHIFNPNLINEAKFGFNRSTSNSYNHSRTGSVYQIVVATGPGPGFATQNYDYSSIYVGNTFSWIDNLTWTHGRQTLKSGIEIRHIQLNQNYGEHGTVTFATLQQLAANRVSRASLTGALPINDLRKNWFVGYLQDEVKMRPNFDLNLGVRYSVFQVFNEAHGKANPFDFATCGAQGFCGLGANFGEQNYGDLDPRLGFTWSPAQSRHTLVRAGFGMYHEDGQLDDQNLPAKNEVSSYSVKNATYPIAPYFTGPGKISPNAEQRDRKDSYVEQWDLSLQQELPMNLVTTLSYLGSHGVHLLQTNAVNLIDPTTGTVPYPAFAPAIGWRGSVGASVYHALSASVRRPFSQGLLITANYAYAHELDNGSDGSGDGDNLSPQNARCLSCEWASGAWDARHVVNGNAVYSLPFGAGKPMLNNRGLVTAIAGNWQLTTTALARTGFPVNVTLPGSYTAPDGNSGTQRPDRIPGVPLTPPRSRGVAQWINPEAFALPAGEFGNAPRNLLRGPGTWQVDLGAAKTFVWRDRAQMEFRSEFYNVFNHPQLGQPRSTFNPANTTGFGSITGTVNTSVVSPMTPVGSGTPREMQLGVRLQF